MVVHAFPVAKLGALLVKQISKPIANAVKQGAKSSPVFRRYVCLPPAQFYNWCERKGKMWLLKMGQPVNITVLNEAASIELGANLLGEAVIFTIAAGILLIEYNRSSAKETAKEEARKREIQDIKDNLRDLFIQTEEQSAQIRELTRKISHLDTKPSSKSEDKRKPPEEPEVVPKADFVPENANSLDDVDLMKKSEYEPLKGVVFKALCDFETNFLLEPRKKREPALVSIAINHLYQNVYRSHLTI